MNLEFIESDILVSFKCLSKWKFHSQIWRPVQKIDECAFWVIWKETQKPGGVFRKQSCNHDNYMDSFARVSLFAKLVTEQWLTFQVPWLSLCVCPVSHPTLAFTSKALGLCSGYTGEYSGSVSAFGRFWFSCLFVCFLRLYFETSGEVSTSGPAQSLEERCKTRSGWGHWPRPRQK